MTHEFEPTPQPTHQKFIIVRHGPYLNGNLTAEGKRKAIYLAPKIKDFLGPKLLQPGMSVILSSKAVRCQEYAQIIGQELGLSTYIKPILGDEKSDPAYGETIIRDIQNFIDPLGGFKGIILVTHAEQTGYLPSYLLGKDYLDRNLGYLDKGEAYAFDVDQYRESYKAIRAIPESLDYNQRFSELTRRQRNLERAIKTLVPTPPNVIVE